MLLGRSSRCPYATYTFGKVFDNRHAWELFACGVIGASR
jgi:hypothetical protein